MISNGLILAAAEGANPLIPNPWEILVVVVGFLLLMFIVIKFIVPTLEKSYQDRVEAIEGGLAKAEKAQAEANAMMADYESQLADARQEANRIREEARTEGAQIVAEARERAASESARITEQAQAQIAADRAQAAAQLKGEVGTLATTLASKIVGESLEDDARSQRVVDRFLADLDRHQRGLILVAPLADNADIWVRDPTPTADEQAGQHADLDGWVRAAVLALPARRRDIIHGLYWRGQTAAAIAAPLGVTASRVSQIHAESVAMIRDALAWHLDQQPGPALSARSARRRDAYRHAVAHAHALHRD